MPTEADLKMEIGVSRMLRAGVSMAALVVLVGAILYQFQAHGVKPDYHHFHGVPSPALHISPILEGIRHLDSRSIIQLGILLLIATPILRVAYCLFSFAQQKDNLYVLVSALVLTVLLYSFFRP